MFVFTEPPMVELDISVRNGIQIRAGETLKLPALVTGRPPPEVKWTKDEGEIEAERTVIETVGTSSVFSIKPSLRKDHGKYIITATNKSGTKTAWTRVDVMGK